MTEQNSSEVAMAALEGDARIKFAQINQLAIDASAKLVLIEAAAVSSNALLESCAKQRDVGLGLLVETQKHSAELAAAVTLAISSKSQITDSQSVIATKSDHIQAAQEHADKVRAEIDRALTSANQQATTDNPTAARTTRAATKASNPYNFFSRVCTDNREPRHS